MDISVIIPYYNSSEIIERTLESIKDQTYLPKEVIIVDDCSINSYDLGFIEKNKAYYPFELEIIRHKHNKGAPAARNTGRCGFDRRHRRRRRAAAPPPAPSAPRCRPDRRETASARSHRRQWPRNIRWR